MPFLVHQTMLDAGQPKRRLSYWKSEHLETLTDETDRHLAWVRACGEDLRPHSMGTYVNFLTEEADHRRVRAAYGANYGRLAALEARFDPDNVLRGNQNITPAAVAEGASVEARCGRT